MYTVSVICPVLTALHVAIGAMQQKSDWMLLLFTTKQPASHFSLSNQFFFTSMSAGSTSRSRSHLCSVCIGGNLDRTASECASGLVVPYHKNHQYLSSSTRNRKLVTELIFVTFSYSIYFAL